MSGIIIVGAGQAAGQAAAVYVKRFEGPVTIFGEEAQAPYQRPPRKGLSRWRGRH